MLEIQYNYKTFIIQMVQSSYLLLLLINLILTRLSYWKSKTNEYLCAIEIYKKLIESIAILHAFKSLHENFFLCT